MRFRSIKTLLAAGMVLAASGTQAATALPPLNADLITQLPDPNGTVLPGVPNPVINTTGIVLGAAGTLTGGLAAATAPLPPVGPVLGSVSTTTSQISSFIASASIRSTWRAAGGALVVREHRLLPLLPIPLNVDQDLLPEFLATVSPAGANAFQIKLDKALLAEANLPVKLELVVPNPAGRGADTWVAAGYDALDSNAPVSWAATLTLQSLADPVRFRFDVRTRNPGLRNALVFELFRRLPDGSREAALSTRAGFTPVPTVNSHDVTIGRDGQTVVLTSDTRSILELEARLSGPQYEGQSPYQNFAAVLNRLPTGATLRINSPFGEFKGVEFDGSHGLDHLDVAYEHLPLSTDGGASLFSASAQAQAVPTALDIGFARNAAGRYIVYAGNARVGAVDLATSGYGLSGGARELVSRVEGLPGSLRVELPGTTGTTVRFSTEGGSVEHALFQFLGSSSQALQFRRQAGDLGDDTVFAADADGITLRQWRDDYALAAQFRGLRAAELRLDPQPRLALDLDPALARGFGLSLRQSDGFRAQSPGYANIRAYYEGYLANVPGSLSLELPVMEPNADGSRAQRLAYRAGGRVDGLDLRSNFGQANRYGRLSFSNLPAALDLCLGTQAAGRQCLRPRPNDGRPAIGSEPQRVVMNADDLGSSVDDGRGPWSLDGLFCYDQIDGAACAAGQSEHNARFENLRLHNAQLGLDATICQGLLFCGHIDGDTRGLPLSGRLSYWDRNLARVGLFDYSLQASVVFPEGFWLNQRYTDWSGDSLIATTDYADHVYGSYHCPAGTELSARISDNLGTAVYDQNIAPHYLCSDTAY